jgi:hypothetical protein
MTMADYGDSDRTREFPMEPERRSLGSFDAPSLFTGALVGTALGALFAFFIRRPRADDEPPIRVKGGSIHFEVLDDDIYWVEDGSKKKWRLSDGEKGPAEKYSVDVVVTQHGTTTRRSYLDVNRVIVRYDADLAFVEIKSAGRHSKVTSRDEMNSESDPRLVTHPRNIKEIQLDNKVVYFAADGHLDEMVIYNS